MNNNILQALEKLFDRHRIVFWYDNKNEMRDEFAGIEIKLVNKGYKKTVKQ